MKYELYLPIRRTGRETRADRRLHCCRKCPTSASCSLQAYISGVLFRVYGTMMSKLLRGTPIWITQPLTLDIGHQSILLRIELYLSRLSPGLREHINLEFRRLLLQLRRRWGQQRRCRRGRRRRQAQPYPLQSLHGWVRSISPALFIDIAITFPSLCAEEDAVQSA